METKLQAVRAEFGWSQSRLVVELRRRAALEGTPLGSDATMKTEVSRHENGRVTPSHTWRRLYRAAYGRTDEELGFLQPRPEAVSLVGTEELSARLAASAALSIVEVQLLARQVDQIRTLDRQIGAHAVLDQLRNVIGTITALREYSLRPSIREALAALLADAGALAGWQALDVGSISQAWRHYETAKEAAREAGSPALLAHAMAEQSILILEVGEPRHAVELIQAARSVNERHGPPLLTAWLHATEGEAHSVAGADRECRNALDAAFAQLPRDTSDPALPFIFLDEPHISRWRGNCLARLGDEGAVDALTNALATMDASFARAEAGLRCDLAQAMVIRGDLGEAHAQARRARQMAMRVGSVRQLRRVERLISRAGLTRDASSP